MSFLIWLVLILRIDYNKEVEMLKFCLEIFRKQGHEFFFSAKREDKLFK